MNEQKNQGDSPGQGDQQDRGQQDRGQQKPDELLAEKRGQQKPDQPKPEKEKEGVVPDDEMWQGEGMGT